MSSLHPIRDRRKSALAVALLSAAVALPAQQTSDDSEIASRAEQLAREGKSTHAQELLQGFILQHPASVPAHVVLGELALNRRDYPEALEHFETALRTAPEDEHARASERTTAEAYALQQRAAGENQGALLTLQHASQVLEGDISLLIDLGIHAQSMHLLKTSHAALAQALQVDQTDTRAIYAMANLETEQQDFTSAALHYMAFLKTKPSDASAHYGLGRVYQLQQRNAEAIQLFQQSIALQPVQTESYYQVGQIALDEHRDADARESFRKVLGRMPAHGGALTGLGIVEYRARDFEAAARQLRSAITAAPDYQLAHYYLGLALTHLNQPDQAKQQLHRATELAEQQQGKSKPLGPQ